MFKEEEKNFLLATWSASKTTQGVAAAPALSIAATKAWSCCSENRLNSACVAAFHCNCFLWTCCCSISCCCCCCCCCWSCSITLAARHSRLTSALRRQRNMNMNTQLLTLDSWHAAAATAAAAAAVVTVVAVAAATVTGDSDVATASLAVDGAQPPFTRLAAVPLADKMMESSACHTLIHKPSRWWHC